MRAACSRGRLKKRIKGSKETAETVSSTTIAKQSRKKRMMQERRADSVEQEPNGPRTFWRSWQWGRSPTSRQSAQAALRTATHKHTPGEGAVTVPAPAHCSHYVKTRWATFQWAQPLCHHCPRRVAEWPGRPWRTRLSGFQLGGPAGETAQNAWLQCYSTGGVC